MSEKGFIEHIGGLRGLAILLVVFYHLGNMGFPQGFLGVEVFLVLFGYFMLKHFVCDEEFAFKPGEYLAKRFCRLYPPFLWVALAALVLAAVFYPYPDMHRAGRAGFAALFGFSNYFLDKTGTGYFAEGTRTNPFMHTWYFSVIVQSCVLYAVLAWLMRGTRRWVRIAVLLLVCAVSFMLNPVLYFANPNCSMDNRLSFARYYWLAPRLWEVAAGGLLYLLPQIKSQAARRVMWVVSIAAIVVLSLFKFKYVEPAYAAAVAATAALVCYAPEGAWRKLLANRFMVYTGKISYSLFLVHWLLIAFTVYIGGQELTLAVSLAIIAASYALAALLYRVAESKPARLAPTLVSWACLVAVCAAVVSTNGFRDYLHQDVNHAFKASHVSPGVVCLDDDALYSDYPKDFIGVPSPFGGVGENWLGMKFSPGSIFRLGTEGTPSFVIFGDSHAQAMAQGLHGLALRNGATGIYLHTYVMPIWNYRLLGPAYQYVDKEKAETLVAWLGAHREIRTVVLTLWWADHFKLFYDWQLQRHPTGESEALVEEGLRTFIGKLREQGKRVVILADNPRIKCSYTSGYLYSCVMRGEPVDMGILSCTREKYDETNSAAHAAFARIQEDGLADVFYPSDCLFENGEFKAYDGERLYMEDDHHLSLDGVMKALESVETALMQKLKAE